MNRHLIVLRVLLVEDHPGDARLIREMLKDIPGLRLDIEVVEYLSDAVKRLAEGGIDVVLLDLTLPDAAGLDSVKGIVRAEPHIPIVVLTEYNDHEMAVAAVSEGAQDFVVKGSVEGDVLGRSLRYAVERKRSERSLQESQHRLQAIFDSAQDAVVLFSSDGDFIDVNPAACKLTAHTREELLETSVKDALFGGDEQAYQDTWQQLGPRKEMAGEFTIKRRDGIIVQAEYRSVANVEPGIHLSIIRDVTERRWAEQALQASEMRYRQLVELSPDAVVLTDINLQIILCNRRVLEMYGYDNGRDVIGVSALDFVLTDDYNRILQRVDTIIHSRTEEPSTSEYVFLRRDGSTFLGEMNMSVMWNASGEPLGFLCIIRDITERQQARQALLESRGRLQALFNNTQEGFFLLDDEARIIDVNPAGYTLVGADAASLRGRFLWDLTDEYTAESWTEFLSQEKTVGELQVQLSHMSEPHYIDYTGISNIAEGLHLLVIRDITERRRVEAAEHEQRMLAEALRNTAAVLNSTLDFEQVLDRILDNVECVLPHDAANILLIENHIGHIKRAQGYYVEQGLEKSLAAIDFDVLQIDHMRKMIETGEPHVAHNIRLGDDLPPNSLLYEALSWIRSFASAPISRDGEVIGFISVDSTEPNTFTAKHGERLQAFADQVSIAIRNAQFYAAEQHRRQIAEKLQQASAAINSTLEPDEVYARVLDELREVLDYDTAIIHKKASNDLVIEMTKGLKHPEKWQGYRFKGAEYAPAQQILEMQKPLVLDRVAETHPTFADWLNKDHDEIGSWLGVPLVVNSESIGLLSITRHAVQAFTDDEVDLVVAFSNHAATAMQNARLYAELENYSSTLINAVSEATADMRQTLEQREAILNNSPDSILLLSPDGTVETANLTFYQELNYQPEDIHGELPTLLVERDYVSLFQLALDTAIRTQEAQRFEAVVCCTPDGSFDADIALAPVTEQGKLLGIVCNIRDVSAFKEVERMKDALISTAAHELRTPLTTIQGFSELLLTRNLDAERKERYLNFINEQSRQLAGIIDGLLDISRLEAGMGLKLEPKPIDIGPVIVDAAQPFVETSPQHNFELTGLDKLPYAQADPVLMSQVVKNLVSNAVKYSPGGGTVTVSGEYNGNGMIAISIGDHGIGIAKEHLDRLFEKFYRIDTSNSAVGGTGLGLTICKLIVEKHGGEITVESAPGQGSTFTFTVPLAAQNAQPGSSPPPDAS